jgi:hypothetical protein
MLPIQVVAATYYVDSANGNDQNTGLSEGSSRRTAGSISQLPLVAGDTVLFRRGQRFDGVLEINRSGGVGQPIRIGAWSSGAVPILFEIRLNGSYVVLSDLEVDHQKGASDAIRIRSAESCTLRNIRVHNGTRDGIDADRAHGLLIEDVEIHHLLSGSYGSEDDAHGIAITSTNGVTVRRANIHHVSGDSVQVDPNRIPGAISDNIVIEDSELWTGPLLTDFNTGWRAGNSPGENAIDTKVLQSGFANEIRMRITLRNVTAYGWTAIPQISNRAAFNLKEKITANLDRVTVYDSQIAFRIRGGLGNADTTISNAVIYDVDTAVRAEDGILNLRVFNSTFGNGVGQHLQHAGSSSGVSTWDWRNNAFVGSKPIEAGNASNRVAGSQDFANSAGRDYHLSATSSLADQGVAIASVTSDRDGNPRSAPYDVGAYEGAGTIKKPRPPVLRIE